MTETEFVGTHEVTEIHGVPRHRVLRFMERGLWPKPIADLKCGLVFRASEVRQAVKKLRAGGQL